MNTSDDIRKRIIVAAFQIFFVTKLYLYRVKHFLFGEVLNQPVVIIKNKKSVSYPQRIRHFL